MTTLFQKHPTQIGRSKDLKIRQRGRQCARVLATLALPLLVGGCGDKDRGPRSEAGEITAARFVGTVASDEPRATLVARDILENGGNAADAVTAGLFAMSVTYPTAVSLGASGLCVAVDAKTKRADAIEFLPAMPPEGGDVPIPGFVRGLALLQSSYGRMRWGQVVVPAETLARNGEPASRAFIQSALESRPPVANNPNLPALLAGRGGGLRKEGEQVPQPQLAALLGRLRAAGPADFYQGLVGDNLLQDIADADGKVTAAALRGYAATVTKPITVPYVRDMTLYFSANQRGGAIAAWLMEQGFSAERFSLLGGGSFNPRALAAGIGQAYRGLEAGAPIYEHGSASISAMDKDGGAVACAVGLGRPFGGRMVGARTGILMPAKPNAAGDEMPYLTALVAANFKTSQSFAASAASGGAPSPASLAQAMLAALNAKAMQPGAALAQPRLFQPAPQAPVLHEAGIDAGLLASLTGRGVAAVEVRRLGRLTLATCTEGVPRAPATCRVAADKRGFGLATGDEF